MLITAIDTKKALLDAGEKLLIERGITGLTVRAVTEAAKANLGAITYHFGSKERLVEEIFLRRLRPVHQASIARLDALAASLAGREPKLDEIIEILVRSIIEAWGVEDNEMSALKLIQRGIQDLPPETKTIVEKESAEFIRRFDNAILHAVPNLSPEELYWRQKFFMGALSFGVDTWTSFGQLPYPNSDVQPKQLDSEAFIQRLVTFICGGITAPLPDKS
jgi:AcrR family transcriptional regulator